jgi:hypothetical protein
MHHIVIGYVALDDLVVDLDLENGVMEALRLAGGPGKFKFIGSCGTIIEMLLDARVLVWRKLGNRR